MASLSARQVDNPLSKKDVNRGNFALASELSSKEQSRTVLKRVESACVPSARRNSRSDSAPEQQPIRSTPQLASSSSSSATSSPSSASDSRSNEGILKLAVIPPVASKEETIKHHQHLARSHPMASSSEPLGRPIDALLPLVKQPVSSHASPAPKVSAAAQGLDRISARVANDSRNSGLGDSGIINSRENDIDVTPRRDRQQQQQQPRRARSEYRTRAVGPRSTSEPAIKQPMPAQAAPSPPRDQQRHTRTSVDYNESVDDQRKSQGSEIMYSVVKGAPTKDPRPKLVGATGSGTVLVTPRARPENQLGDSSSNQNKKNDRSNRQQSGSNTTDRSEEVFKTNLVSRNIDRRAANPPPPAPSTGASTASAAPRPPMTTQFDNQVAQARPKSDRNYSSESTSKRESVQSFTSFTSLDESIPEDSPGSRMFDNRAESEEETTLLPKPDADMNRPKIAPENQKKQGTKESAVASIEHNNKVKEGASAKARPLASVQGRKHPVQEGKYASGTPMGTAKTSSSPGNSTLDSTDPLFQPTAPLISYPALDAYLSSLKLVRFSEIPKLSIFPTSLDAIKSASAAADDLNSKKSSPPALLAKAKKPPPPDPREGMFPPLGLVPVGITLDELKTNITKPPGFFDQELQNVMLSSAVDGIMSGESSNIGISWMRLEIIRDFLQFVALYLSVSGNTFVNQKWLYATVNIIPALLSLDFPRALGYGMVFLMLFALICWIALYTFKIMTRTDPNDDIEGLEVNSWSLRSKKQRIETISIVFLLTTLYLPLAKLSFDALVWSDTMWPIPNPYKNTDFPVLEPLGPNGIYRDPSDFCYVTSMKIQDLNFAYVIIPLAIFTLCVNTIYFPLAIRRLVILNLPRIDKYTEQGERRLDLDEEYKRLTNSDNCPYNFLYNGYRREFGTYKVIVMITKLAAVTIVVLFSKDNCLFRGYERRTIESIRAGLQIVFTASLIYRHYRTQPFLYASQNLSEYWSRACTVATSVIGLFIVLNVGPVSVNALGVMLVATYVLMCVIVVWFVIRQTQKFQILIKQIQQRLDFSLEIFNPKLNYFKHIKRRVWQESWSTILLAEDCYKMPADKVIAYSQSPHRPPYLLNFTGTVAERHVENLRIVRQIGLRAYSQACQFLTPAMVRKRSLILNAFVGPDMYYAPEFMASNIKTYFGKAYVVPFPFSVVFVYDESSVVVTLVKEHDLDRYIQQNQDPEIERRRELRYQLRALDGKFVVRPFTETPGIQRGRDSNGTLEMSLVNAPVSYKRGLFTIHRKKMSSWQGHNMNPGFSITITYSDGEIQDPQGSSQLLHETTIGQDVIGITRDFQVTPALSRLLRDNHALVSRGVKKVKRVMQAYQAHYRNEALRKDATLSYDFFINVYDNPMLKHRELEPLLLATEENSKIRHPDAQVSLAVQFLYERMSAVNRTRCHQWWYLFWDDLYRKNHEEIPQLVPKAFSPAFPGSICYRPMARPDLETFLETQGCWLKNGKSGFMNVGVLNRMYTFLNELVFEKMTREQRQKQLELSTVERLRLENLFLVTKARIHPNGTYKRMPNLQEEDLEGLDILKGLETGSLGRKPSQVSLQRQKTKKGWFESITPGRLRKKSHSRPFSAQQQQQRPQQQPGHLEHFSPGYIIPQTWHQKASRFTALLIGGRPDDVLGESDEEDNLEDEEEEDEASLLAKKRRRIVSTKSRSVETLVNEENSYGLRKTVSVEGARELAPGTERVPQRTRRTTIDQYIAAPNIPVDKTKTGTRKNNKPGHRSSNGLQSSQSMSMDEDSGMASETMSITSMSSEDYCRTGQSVDTTPELVELPAPTRTRRTRQTKVKTKTDAELEGSSTTTEQSESPSSSISSTPSAEYMTPPQETQSETATSAHEQDQQPEAIQEESEAEESDEDEDEDDQDLDELLLKAQVSLKRKASSGGGVDKKEPLYNFPKLEAGLDTDNLYIKQDNKRAKVDLNTVVVVEKGTSKSSSKSKTKPALETCEVNMSAEKVHISKKQKREEKEKTTGKGWFDLPQQIMTPELKRDLQILKLRNVLDPKRFYKREDKGKPKFPKYFQVGTIIEGNTEFFSSRLTKKERATTITGEVMKDLTGRDYYQRKFNEIQETKQSGGKRFNKKGKGKQSKSWRAGK
ncbi:hypothetical protein BGZ83_003799 [Gryganskiella cystojenkinii]|nr:hypothetical protein BGZ83_003799 [Gryganskiella cystojenkinii]